MKEGDIPKEVSAVTKVLNACVNEYHIEEERTLRGLASSALFLAMKGFLLTLSDGTDRALSDRNSTSKHCEHSHLYLLINIRSQPQPASSAPQSTRGEELFSQNHSFSLTEQNPLHRRFPVSKLNHLQRKSPHKDYRKKQDKFYGR